MVKIPDIKLSVTMEPTGVRLRTGIGPKPDLKIEREGGKFGAGLIRGFAVITRGEALGHGLWIDDDFLDQVVAASKGKTFRSRLAHPGLSSDGITSKLGQGMDYRRDGDTVRGDLHFTKASHETPDGDLAKYVMNLAEETPEDFGASIVFDPDIGEMERFESQYTDSDGEFESPDRDNTHNYPHARLAALTAVDIVDKPAANPGGMLSASGNQFTALGDGLLGYVFCDGDVPEVPPGFPHPERVRRFTQDWLHRNKYMLTTIEAIGEQQKALETARRENTMLRKQIQLLRNQSKSNKEGSI